MDVTVIIPTFNRLWALPRAVESCLTQGAETEVIVIDDGSNDGTWEWLASQSRVRAIRQKNLGKCWAVNHGYSLAKGRYIRILDSDDWLLPNANVRQTKLADEVSADLVVAGYEIHYEGSDFAETRAWESCDDLIAQFLGECDSSHYSAFLFRREFLRDIPHRPDFAYRDDRLFTLEAVLSTPKVVIDGSPGFAHLHHKRERLQAATGMRSVVTHFQQLTLYRRVLGELASKGELTERRCKASAQILWPLAHWIAYASLDEACETVDWIFQLDPGFQVPECGLLGVLYRRCGFRQTERLLALRRWMLGLLAGPRRVMN